MINLIKTHPIKISILLFTLLSYILFNYYIEPVLYFHEMQPPFLANYNFFNEYFCYPGGLAEYISNFISQFFYFGWVGTLFICLIGILYIVTGYYFIVKAKLPLIFTLLWSIPFLLLTVQFTNYHFPLSTSIELLFALFFSIVFCELSKKSNRIIIYSILGTILYCVADNGAFALFTLMCICIVFFFNRKKKDAILIAIFILFYILFTYISYRYIFNISYSRLWLNFIPDTTIDLMFLPNKLYYSFLISIPAIFIVLLLLKTIIAKKAFFENKQILISYVFTFILAAISLFLFKTNTNVHEKNIIKCDYNCYIGNWDGVISIATQDKEYNVLINTNFNRAIDQSGLLFDKFFDYPQFLGPGILYPDLLRTSEMAMLSSDYYFDLGYISESLHWAHEAQTSQPYNIRILKRLVMVNLIDENYKASEKYLNLLNDNFLAKDFVAKYSEYLKDTANINGDYEIASKKAFAPKHKIVGNIESRLNDLIEQNKNNKRAWDYIQLFNLLDHNLNGFMKNLPKWRNTNFNNPCIIDQAVLLYLYQTKQMKNLDGYSKVEINKLSDYLKTLNIYNNDVTAAKETLAINFSNTYMFYLMYNSPRVTNISYTSEDVTNYNR
jgi:hypothetical protein